MLHISKQLVQAAGSYGMDRDEGLEKHTRAHLDLLERSQWPGHHCLKCVLSVQYLYVCVCVCIHESLLFHAKRELEMKAFGGLVYPSIEKTYTEFML